MLISDLPCQVCEDRTLVKFVKLRVTTAEADATRLGLEIYCPAHNAGRRDTALMRESEADDELYRC